MIDKVGNIEREKLRAGVTRVLALFISNVNGKSHHGLSRNPNNYFVGGKTWYAGKCEIGAVLVFL